MPKKTLAERHAALLKKNRELKELVELHRSANAGARRIIWDVRGEHPALEEAFRELDRVGNVEPKGGRQ